MNRFRIAPFKARSMRVIVKKLGIKIFVDFFTTFVVLFTTNGGVVHPHPPIKGEGKRFWNLSYEFF